MSLESSSGAGPTAGSAGGPPRPDDTTHTAPLPSEPTGVRTARREARHAHDDGEHLRREAQQRQDARTSASEANRSDANGGGTLPVGRRATRRARKVRRIVRRVDAWSVLKFSLLFYLCTFLIALVAGVLLWSAAQSAGTIEGFEGFIEDVGGYDFFKFDGDQIFKASLLGGLILVVAGAAGNVLLAALFNLISDLTGGIRLTVIEEEKTLPAKPRRRPAPSGDGSPPRRANSVSEL